MDMILIKHGMYKRYGHENNSGWKCNYTFDHNNYFLLEIYVAVKYTHVVRSVKYLKFSFCCESYKGNENVSDLDEHCYPFSKNNNKGLP